MDMRRLNIAPVSASPKWIYDMSKHGERKLRPPCALDSKAMLSARSL